MKTRIIHTRFWQDGFILSLSPVARLLFIYTLTNERLGLTGAYECPDQFIQLETGLKKNQLEKAKSEIADKVMFENGWVALKNATKYNNYATSDVHKDAYNKELKSLPVNIRNFLLDRDYSCTSYQLDKNKKTKIINNKKKKEGECEGGKKTKKEKKYKSLNDIKIETLQEIAREKNYELEDVKRYYEKMKLYCQYKGKRYKNYKSALLSWLLKGWEEGKIKKVKPKDETQAVTAYEEINLEGKKKVKEIKNKLEEKWNSSGQNVSAT